MWTVAIADEHVRKSCVQCLPVEREKGQNEKKNMLNMVKHGDIKLTKLTGLWLAPVIVQFVIIRLNGLIWWNRWNHQKTNATYKIYKFLWWQRWCAATCSPFFFLDRNSQSTCKYTFALFLRSRYLAVCRHNQSWPIRFSVSYFSAHFFRPGTRSDHQSVSVFLCRYNDIHIPFDFGFTFNAFD